MRVKARVVVITGASSGIGLATARLLANTGAKLVLASRNEVALREICRDLEEAGAETAFVVADVSDPRQVEGIAKKAVDRFGGFDVWVNNAGVSTYGRTLDVPIDDERRVLDVTFWGVVHGSQIALAHLREKGGVIINVGSVASQRALQYQAAYSAAKHAVKAYTDTLRMEVKHAKLPVKVALIKPASIDTPLPQHSRNHLERRATLPPPLYAPEVVARAILACIRRPRRELIVGGLGAKPLVWLEKLVPRAADLLVRKVVTPRQFTSGAKVREDGLYAPPREEGQVRGGNHRWVLRRSAYTAMVLHPVWSFVVTLAALGAWGLQRAGNRR